MLLHTKASVRRFSRYPKYTVGTLLRQQAMTVMRGVHLAVIDIASSTAIFKLWYGNAARQPAPCKPFNCCAEGKQAHFETRRR